MIQKTLNGFCYEDEKFYAFFGNKIFSKNKRTLEENSFIFGHQTHDSFIEPASLFKNTGSCSFISSSDGLETSMLNQKLAIITADCIPCFILNNNHLYSLHLGWRGVHKGLFDKALSQCSGKIKVIIGPHIQKESFEVGPEVVQAFKTVTPKCDNTWYTQKNPLKYYISLVEILRAKARGFNVEFHISTEDTFTNSNFNSYRRDSKTLERNISFAFLKNRVK